ncbi:MAG: ABC transporter permease subunit [Chitinophagaceae bacterium]|nr:ABC transporter permease subunit [Chitinophagaceae bacterium]
MLKMLLGNPFEFPEVFRTTAFASSLFVLIPAILVIMLITNEYTYKTNRQNVIDGWSRNEFLIAKFLNVVIISMIVIALYVIVTLSIGFSTTGPDVKINSSWHIILHFIVFRYLLNYHLHSSLASLLKERSLPWGYLSFIKLLLKISGPNC